MEKEVIQQEVKQEAKAEQKPAVVASEQKPTPKTFEHKGDKNTKKKESSKHFSKKSFGKFNNSGFESQTVEIKRISKTTKGGRRMRFSALVVIGDKNGKVGYGIGKATEVPNAIKKATKNARNSVRKVIINKKGTLYHEVIGYAAASKVLIKPAKPGTGIVAGGAIRSVIEYAGFKDVYTKNLGSNTKTNMVQATLNALLNQKHPSTIANLRDKNVKEL